MGRARCTFIKQCTYCRSRTAHITPKQGWEEFTDAVIDVLNEQREHIVFILWGAYAQRKGQRINREKHLVLTAAHPSPLAANRGGFWLQSVFKTNQYLKQYGIEPIDWQLDA